jgi:hypothetical protein
LLVRGKDPNINANGFGSADALDLTLLQHAQNLHVWWRAPCRQFRRENGAAVAEFESAEPLARRTGERSLLVTEEFAFDQIVRE